MIRPFYRTTFATLLAINLFVVPVCHPNNTNPHDGLTWLNRMARVVNGYFSEFGSFKRYWQRACGFSDSERIQWLAKYRLTSYDTPRGYYGPTLDSLEGYDTVKKRVAELLEYVKNPELYAQTHDTIVTNYCFYGPRANGKSCFVHALMHEIQVTNSAFQLFELPGEELLTTLLQEDSLEGFVKRFQVHGPCVIFIKNICAFTEYFNTTLIVNDLCTIPGIRYSSIKALSDAFARLSSSPEAPVILLFATHRLEAGNGMVFDFPVKAILYTHD